MNEIDARLDRFAAALRSIGRWAGSGLAKQIEDDLRSIPQETSLWRPIGTAPTLDRVFVAGWQPAKGTCAAYWWYEEDVTDENGIPMGRPEALMWQPLPDAPTQPPASP